MKKGSGFWFGLAAVFLILVLVSYLWDTKDLRVAPKTDYAQFKAQLQRMIPVLLRKYEVPGTAIALIREGNLDWVQGFGWADEQAKVPVEEDTVFQVASNSKTVTVWGAMKLYEQGKLDLDTPVEQYLTRWKLPESKFDKDQVTIGRIFSHTAGLSPRGYAGYSPDQKLPTLEESLSGQAPGVAPVRLMKEPGLKYKYAGGGYSVLQLVMEEVGGRDFSKYMKEEVLGPLGMKDSSFEWAPELRAKTAKGYDVIKRALPNYLFTEKAAAGLYTTAPDLARFLVMNLEVISGKEPAGGVITSKSLALMWTAVDLDKNYGLGYFIEPLGDQKTRLIYHGGSNRGWRSQFGLLPDLGEGLVVLTNSDNGASFHSDLLHVWSKWETGTWPKAYLKTILLRVLMKTLVLGLVLGTLFGIWMVIRDLRAQKRALLFTAGITGPRIFGQIIRAVVLWGLGVGLWWILFYTGLIYSGWMFASFMPMGFNLFSLVAFIVSVFYLIGTFFVKTDAGGVGQMTAVSGKR